MHNGNILLMEINLTGFCIKYIYIYMFHTLQTERTHWWWWRSPVCSVSWWWRSRSPRSLCGEWPHRWSAGRLLQQVRWQRGQRLLDVPKPMPRRFAVSCAASILCLGCGRSRDTPHLEKWRQTAERDSDSQFWLLNEIYNLQINTSLLLIAVNCFCC